MLFTLEEIQHEFYIKNKIFSISFAHHKKKSLSALYIFFLHLYEKANAKCMSFSFLTNPLNDLDIYIHLYLKLFIIKIYECDTRFIYIDEACCYYIYMTMYCNNGMEKYGEMFLFSCGIFIIVLTLFFFFYFLCL